MKKLLILLAVSVGVCVSREVVWSFGPGAQKRDPNAMHSAADAMIAPDDPIDDAVEKVVHVDQNWHQKQRDEFYTLTQGSRLIPYDWFLHLEQAKGKKTELFRSVKNMNRYRYLTQKESKQNPHGLPVGFVKDPKEVGEKIDWLGMTCAACHTSQVHHKKVAYRIDGGPAMADHDQFLLDLSDALRATVKDDEKFKRFAKSILGGNQKPADTKKLKDDLEAFTKLRESYNERNKTDLSYGYARLDAFGRIMNETMTRHIGLKNDNAKSPNAPVSYPHLWDTPHYDRVQWNGIAQNDKLFGPPGRNVGEVLGVFGSVTVPVDKLDPRFKSSVNMKNLRRLEQSVGDLWSPIWPAAFGKLDVDKVDMGKHLFGKHCATCHQNSGINPENPDRTFKASLHSLKDAGTDPRMAVNFVMREGSTGKLKGRQFLDPKKGPVTIGDKDKAGILLLALVNGTILGADRVDQIALFEETLEHLKNRKADVSDDLSDLIERAKKNLSLTKLVVFAKIPGKIEKLNDELQKLIGEIHGDEKAVPPLHYKAGSLNGVWATAPYLHNGSVPNLWELLLPPGKRTKKFEVGSREFDPKHVGFKSDGYAARGGFVFDATIPGNLNGGHHYPPPNEHQLSDEQRWALIEYLKSL